jgi:hypothetical protein
MLMLALLVYFPASMLLALYQFGQLQVKITIPFSFWAWNELEAVLATFWVTIGMVYFWLTFARWMRG